MWQATTADAIEARERAEQLWRAIDALSEKLRVVIVLAGIEGHEVEEVPRVAFVSGLRPDGDK
jgi:DNA-directed RNA polymerase specialized sigma24 family protein